MSRMNTGNGKNEKQGAVIALGMFDGVHMGHRAILQHSIALAEELDAAAVAVSFRTHPQAVFGGEVPLLTLPDEREEIFNRLGLQALMLDFDAAFAHLSPRDFVERLNSYFPIRAMVVGFNNRFGYKAAGDSDTLRAIGREMGFRTEVVEAVNWEGEPVSSSRIRGALTEGRLEEANTMLTRPYFYRGTVQKHRQLGRRIGFPTLNIRPNGKLIVEAGVYAARVKAGLALPQDGDGLWHAVTNVGNNPTVTAERDVYIESHVMGEIPEMYGQAVYVELLQFIRPQVEFPSLEALKTQIAEDARVSEGFLSRYSPVDSSAL